MAPPKCPGCGSNEIATDPSAGSVVCQACGLELEGGILVSEIGFSEGAGGRIHVQGTFVSHHATGLGFRGGVQTSENIKEEGRKRIQQVCQQMGILPSVQRGAQRFYSLAVDNKFNRGRRTDHVVASCIYLYSRFEKDALMLIDFSERLQINVYELGATYLKLRSALNLDQILPEIDPAVYNIRFANRLNFGNKAATVARDASRLVKRFKADWMTAGRRPAGICGACLVMAARMSDFLRTAEEVAQVVKVSPLTIRKRLGEFAKTGMADLTVEQWRTLTDAELEAPDVRELPPVMKRAKAKAKEGSVKRERGASEVSGAGEGSSRSASGSVSPRKRRSEDEDEEDEDAMDPLAREDYVVDIQKAGDDTEEAKAERSRERRQLMASLKQTELDDDEDILVEIAENEDLKDDDNDNLDDSGGFKLPPLPNFKDKEAVFSFLETTYFADDAILYQGVHMRERIERWLQGRDPAEVIGELRRVEWARWERDHFAKTHTEVEFDDLDDDELDCYWVMEEDERNARARMWLSHNSRWLEEDRERQEKKAAYNKAHGIDPAKPKAKRRKVAPGVKKPFSSAREAIDNFAVTKKFSSRINMDALRRLQDGDGDAGLERMEDEKEDGEGEGDEKVDEDGKEDEEDYEYHFDIDDKVDDDDKYDEEDE